MVTKCQRCLDSLGLSGDVTVSMLATVAAQALINTSQNTKSTPAKNKAGSIRPGAPPKAPVLVAQARALKGEGGSEWLHRPNAWHFAQHRG